MIKIKALTEKRMNHSLSVAKLCYDLALVHDSDPMQAYLAGLFHDIARQIPKDEMVELARKHGIDVGPEEILEPLLLHGPLSSCVAAENYGIHDSEILNAISCHTVGREGMNLLDKILFIADKTEPLRKYDGVKELRDEAFVDLESAFIKCVKNEMDYCVSCGYPVHPETKKLYSGLTAGSFLKDVK